MDDWDVVGYKEFRQMSQETTAFDAVITLKGERVLNARNSGTGGSNIYHRTEVAEAHINDRFEADAKQWAPDHGLEANAHFEAGDARTSLKGHQAPLRVSS